MLFTKVHCVIVVEAQRRLKTSSMCHNKMWYSKGATAEIKISFEFMLTRVILCMIKPLTCFHSYVYGCSFPAKRIDIPNAWNTCLFHWRVFYWPVASYYKIISNVLCITSCFWFDFGPIGMSRSAVKTAFYFAFRILQSYRCPTPVSPKMWQLYAPVNIII